MKRCISVCGVLLVTGFAGAAFAADLSAPPPRPTPPPPPAHVQNGTDCFAGVHAGGAFSDDEILSSGDFGSAGFVGGGQAGCDYHFASAWVVGVGGRAAWSSLQSKTPGSGTDGTGAIFPTQFTVANDFLASATTRVGYNFVGGWLAYVAGGAAWTREKADITFVAPTLGVAVNPSATTMQPGWTVGAGLEWAFAPHWSTNFEYDYYDFGSNDFLLIDNVNRVTFSGSLKDTIHTLTVGLNYHL
jgi:outer membrane immunogenic protein